MVFRAPTIGTQRASLASPMYGHSSPKRPLRSRVITLLRRRAAIPGQVIQASFKELAEELGRGFTEREVQVALMELGRESYFLGRPHLSDQGFRGRLAW
jgi:hypothetical protein